MNKPSSHIKWNPNTKETDCHTRAAALVRNDGALDFSPHVIARALGPVAIRLF